ncbi:hypothetical protein OsI_07882 [Oryza sativa Indica Group]|uniref:Uncharacterized protein n=1 Tax=Oryza sativa subsp. indica TaxID=39946 RepID=B8AEQ5_ORYSI|nr:hypothetical protein OsI_07882 [Oryza sativa Indica Group]
MAAARLLSPAARLSLREGAARTVGKAAQRRDVVAADPAPPPMDLALPRLDPASPPPDQGHGHTGAALVRCRRRRRWRGAASAAKARATVIVVEARGWMAARWLAVTAVSSGCGDGDRDCDWRRHGGLRRLAEGVADGRTWLHGSDWRGRRPAWRREAQPMAVVAGKAREAWSVARRPAWRERRNRWREAGLAREARPVVEEAGVA